MFSPDYVKRLAAVDANKQPHNALADAQHQMALLQRLEAASEMLLVNLKAANDGAH